MRGASTPKEAARNASTADSRHLCPRPRRRWLRRERQEVRHDRGRLERVRQRTDASLFSGIKQQTGPAKLDLALNVKLDGTPIGRRRRRGAAVAADLAEGERRHRQRQEGVRRRPRAQPRRAGAARRRCCQRRFQDVAPVRQQLVRPRPVGPGRRGGRRHRLDREAAERRHREGAAGPRRSVRSSSRTRRRSATRRSATSRPSTSPARSTSRRRSTPRSRCPARPARPPRRSTRPRRRRSSRPSRTRRSTSGSARTIASCTGLPSS